MGLIKSIRKVGSKAGGVLKRAAPLLGLIPGVGTVAGAGLGALGSVMEGGNGWGGTLKAGLFGGLSGLGNSMLLGGKGVGGIAGALQKATAAMKGGTAGKIMGGGGDRLANAAKGLLGSSGGGLGTLGKILGLGAAGYGAYTGNKSANDLRKKQSGLMDRQLGLADEVAGQGRALTTDANALRAAALPRITARLAAGPRAAPNFSRFTDQQNPFAKKYRPAIPPPPAMKRLTA